MDIRRFFDRDVIIARLRNTSGIKRAMSTTATVDGHIQNLSNDIAQKLGIVEEEVWRGWFDEDSDIKVGDKLTDQLTGVEYRVRMIIRRQYGINQHKEVILVNFNS